MKHAVNLDLNEFELQNAIIQKLASAPSTKEAKIYYDTTKKKQGYYNGTKWVYPSILNIVVNGTYSLVVESSGDAESINFRGLSIENRDKSGAVISTGLPFSIGQTATAITLTFDQSKLALAASQVGLGNVANVAQLPMSYLDISVTLGGASPSDAKVPSQKAVKTYIDNQIASVASGQSYMGDWDGSKTVAANLVTLGLTEIKKGYQFRVSVAGSVSGVTTPSSGVNLEIGDLIIARSNKTTSITSADFDGFDSTESADLVRWDGSDLKQNGNILPVSKKYVGTISNASTGTIAAATHKCGVGAQASVWLTNGTTKELCIVDIVHNASGDITWSAGTSITGEIIIVG